MDNGNQRWETLVTAHCSQTDASQLKQLGEYRDLLVEWNSRVNLISRKDETNIWPNHIIHSVSVLFMLNVPDGVVIADLGSGGGLPGIPLAILLPKVEVVLIESIRKKCDALADMKSRLGLTNLQVVNTRAEEAGISDLLRNRFDMIIARAVAPLHDLVKWSVPLVRKEHNRVMRSCRSANEVFNLPALVAMKGGGLSKEIADAERLKATRSIRSYDIHFDGIEDTGLVDKKIVIVSL